MLTHPNIDNQQRSDQPIMSLGNNLPPEIIEAILRRLPPKSLGRFKSVSKPWWSIISTPQFIKTHIHQNLDQTSNPILVISDTKSLYSLHINSRDKNNISATAKVVHFPQPRIVWEAILGSCNGLVLAKSEHDSIFVMNPTTRQLTKLPVSPFALPSRQSFVMYGFGYNPSTDDYNVITISFWDTDNEHNPDCTDMFVNIYSLRNNLWNKSDNSRYDHAVGHLVSGVLVNGNLHWLASRRPGYSSAIVAFSLVKEEFNEIELPGDMISDDKAVFNELVELEGKLGLFGSRLGNDLWVMEEYGVGESWGKVSVDGVEIDPVKPVCLIDRDIVLSDEEGVFAYNLDERRCRDVRIEGGPNGFTFGGTYVETLESPKYLMHKKTVQFKIICNA